MKIELKHFNLREISKGYVDNNEEGCFAYEGKLNIRPKYQREFVYKDEKRNEVINTIKKNFPLNIMYWIKNGDNNYEVLDGQQRTISFCQYINSEFSVEDFYFQNLTDSEQNEILDYELNIYICEGTDKEKLDWFKIINIAGEKLEDQELLNAVYTGEWLTDAKKHFSKSFCAAYDIANDYITGSPIRQQYLEVALKWISKDNIKIYMSKHQNDSNCTELWLYFQSVINWIKATFIEYRKEMKKLPWGIYYNEYKDNKYDPKTLEVEIKNLMEDDEVSNQKGIYEYLLSNKKLEKVLNIRIFSEKEKRQAFEKCNGICKKCEEKFELIGMEADHIIPWSRGGKTSAENCQMLCRKCNNSKSNK